MTPKALSEQIDSSVVASAEAALAPARTRLLVSVSLSHRRKPDELRNTTLLVNAENRRKVLTDALISVLQFTER